MNVNTMIESLKEAANTDPTFRSVCHMFAARRRARHQVTVRALALRMRDKKLNPSGGVHADEEYRRVLKRLADLGFGRAELDKRGNVRALQDVRISLNSIGQAALGQTKALATFKLRRRFSSLPVKSKAVVLNTKVREPYAIGLTVKIRDKDVKIQLPDTLSTEEMAGLIQRLRGTDAA